MGFLSHRKPTRKKRKVSVEDKYSESKPPFGERNLSFEKLPLEIIQYIFVLSGEFSLPLCSKWLYHGLTNSKSLKNQILAEHSVLVKTNEWMVLALNSDMLTRKFITRKMLEDNMIRGFYSDSCKIEYEKVNVSMVNEGEGDVVRSENQSQNENSNIDNNQNEQTIAIAITTEEQVTEDNITIDPEVEAEIDPESQPQPLSEEELFNNYKNNLTNKPFLPDDLEPDLNPIINDRQFDLTIYLLNCNCQSKFPNSIVNAACKKNDLPLVQKLVDSNFQLDHSSLISAFENFNADLIDYLLSLGRVDLNHTQLWEYVISTRNMELFNFLKGVGGNPPFHILPKA